MNEGWIAELRQGVDRNIVDPGDRGRVWSKDDAGGVMTYDSQSWQRVPEYRRFIEDSPMAEIAGRILGRWVRHGIDGERDRHDVRSWAMEPGDMVLFNGRTIHGGSGNLAEGHELKVFNTKWLGGDARVTFRSEGMDPNHSEVMIAAGLAPGDRPSGSLYPTLWSS